MLRQFFRLRFSKHGDVRFTSHHDLMRLYMRVLRCAGLPIAMSEGYNPRPRISIPAPLSLGMSGTNEVLDLELSQWCKPQYLCRRLNNFLPDGIRILTAEILSGKPDRNLDSLVYEVPLNSGHPVREHDLGDILDQDSLVVLRGAKKGAKEKNIAPFIGGLRLAADSLFMLLKVNNQGTARPEELLNLLGCEPYKDYFPTRITRTHVSLLSSLQ